MLGAAAPPGKKQMENNLYHLHSRRQFVLTHLVVVYVYF